MTKANAYDPKRGTLPHKVIEFLTTNPDESLSKEDIGVKFDVNPSHVHSSLSLAVEHGAILLNEDLSTGELVYSFGTGVPTIKSAPARHPALGKAVAHAPFGLPAPERAKRFSMDLTTIQIEEGIPLPPRGNARVMEWSTVFSRMQVGQSFQVPSAARSTVNSAITRQHKATGQRYELRKVGDGFRIWRTK